MLRMILLMTGTTALYVLATVALWRFWHRKKDHTTAQKLFIGLFYGLCSIASNHLGIVYQDMVLNVRDLGPLAAGLFFGPLAGIVSGLIGGAERFIIGEYFGIGAFTRIACSLSTVFAGLLAAGLNKWYYRGKRPSAIHCFSLGAEMEVFHMYAVFITHQGQTAMALEVVKTCAVPMIAFTAAGLAACSLIIARLSGEAWFGSISETKKETPIDIRFQRWLLTVVAALFAISFTMNYSVQTRVANENAKEEMQFQQYQYQLTYQDNGDLKTLKKELDDNNFRSDTVYLLVDAGQMLQYTMIGSPEGSKPADPEQAALIAGHADGEPFQAAIKQIGGAECFCVAGRLEGGTC